MFIDIDEINRRYVCEEYPDSEEVKVILGQTELSTVQNILRAVSDNTVIT